MSVTFDLPYTVTYWHAPSSDPWFDAYEPPSVQKKKAREKSGPSIDDVGMGMDFGSDVDSVMGGLDLAKKKDDPSKDPNTPKAMDAVKQMSARVARLLQLVEARKLPAGRPSHWH